MELNNMNKEITYHIVNSLLAGALVFLGAFSDGSITCTGIIAAISAAGIVAIKHFKNYWEKEERDYCSVFNFV